MTTKKPPNGDGGHSTPNSGPHRHLASEVGVLVRHLGQQLAIGLLAGLPAGVASWAFLELLDRAIEFREDRAGWLLWLLPLGAAGIGAAYQRFGGRAARGTSLVIEQLHEPGVPLPRRMAPLVLVGTVAAHLFGASVGREGTALQMSAGLADNAARLRRIKGVTRRELLVAAVAGGFGAVFGVPVAGAVFALEVQSIGRVRFEAVLASFTAAFAGDRVVRFLGHEHAVRDAVSLEVDTWLVLRVAVAGLAFGGAAALFVWLTHRVKSLAARIPWPPLRAAAAGAIVVAGAVVLGRQYLSLSLPLAAAALSGAAVAPLAWLAKIAFTAVCLGAGLPGGEVTPLFVIGALLGATLAGPLGLPVGALAAIGFVAVFGAAANTPIACTILFVELFGGTAIVPAAIACAVAYMTSATHGIYPTQRLGTPKRRPTAS